MTGLPGVPEAISLAHPARFGTPRGGLGCGASPHRVRTGFSAPNQRSKTGPRRTGRAFHVRTARRSSMQVYLPIAEMSVNALVILILGGSVGFLSGLFGVGGGFLMTPLLIFVGVPPAVAVGTQSNQLVGASVSGVIGHWRRGNVDFRMGSVL